MTRPRPTPAAAAGERASAADAQRRFDELRERVVRRRGGRILDLSYANPKVPLDPRARAALVDAASSMPVARLQYTPLGGATKARRLVATDLAERTGLPFAYRDVVLTGGATAALALLFDAALCPGDEVVVLTPSWFDYPLYLSVLGVSTRFVALDARKRLDLDALAAAIGPATAGVIVTQPGSPTGVVLSWPELSELADVLANAARRTGRQLLIVSDEAHRDVTWSGDPVPSPLAHHPHCATVHSYGKAWSMQGLRIGYAAVSPSSPRRDELRSRLIDRARARGFGSPSSLMQEVAVRLIRERPDHSWLDDAQRLVRDRLASFGYELCDADATMFVYGRTPGDDDWRFVDELARRGVLALPSALCHEDGHFRLALNVGAGELEPALDAFGDVLEAL